MMKLEILFGIVFIVAALEASAVNDASHISGGRLKTYSIDGYEFEAGFLPEKGEYVWGEPMHFFIYTVKNTGDKTLSFEEGGDYRGGRSESHKITAVDGFGNAVAVPEMYEMGGLVWIIKLEPGQVFQKMLPVSKRLTFTGPGDYTVTGQRTLRIGETFSDPNAIEAQTSNSFDLTIHPYSDAAMADVVKELADAVWAAGDISPVDIEVMEPMEITPANRLYLNLSSLTEIDHPDVVPTLIAMAKTGPINLRRAALGCLGNFPDDARAVTVVLEALDGQGIPVEEDRDLIAAAAASALGSMKSQTAIDTLIKQLAEARPAIAAAILRAMGTTQSQRVYDILVESLNHEDKLYRYGAVDGLSRFGGEDAAASLKARIPQEPDMDLREYIVKTLAETMREPIDPQWLVPVIQSRKGTSSIGDAPRLMRLYGGPKSVAALFSCLDYDDPSIRSSYNWWVIYSQSSCEGGMITPWISDLNRDGTPEEIENNRRTLRLLKGWTRHYYANRLDEKAMEKWPDTWGEPVDGICVRLRLNQRVWPEGMPQLIMFDLREHPASGSVNISTVPEPLEVELNGDWYIREPALTEPTAGLELMGKSVQNIVLDEYWQRKSDGQPLQLTPGTYTLRLGLSIRDKEQRTALAFSNTVEFVVIAID